MSEAIIQQAILNLQKAIDHLHEEFSKLRTGRANAALVENIEVENYGTKMPLKALANISIADAKTIAIQPWDKSGMTNIEKAIQDSGLGLNPINNGVVIRLVLPALTEERRRDLTKLVHELAEKARITVRQERHHGIAQLKELEKEKQISEDQRLVLEKRLQEKIDEFNKKIEENAKHKEQDIMTV